MERTFTIESSEVDVTGGRFTGKAPYNVAAKVARSLFKDLKGKNKKKTEIRFAIRETTRGSDNKTFHYIGTKKTLPEPKVVVRGDVELKIEHVYHIKSCRV
jgi:secreted Zn-dependent insulinase-like peptidase